MNFIFELHTPNHAVWSSYKGTVVTYLAHDRFEDIGRMLRCDNKAAFAVWLEEHFSAGGISTARSHYRDFSMISEQG